MVRQVLSAIIHDAINLSVRKTFSEFDPVSLSLVNHVSKVSGSLPVGQERKVSISITAYLPGPNIKSCAADGDDDSFHLVLCQREADVDIPMGYITIQFAGERAKPFVYVCAFNDWLGWTPLIWSTD
jgi:hypothetical protein